MKIKAAVIGMGIGEKHLEAIDKYKGSSVNIVCEKDNKKYLYLKKKYPKKIITKDENIIFKDKKINLVSIASYDHYHYSQIIKAIKYGKNIIVEKPMCLKIEQLKKITKLVKKKNIKIFSNLVLRVNSLFKDFKKRVKRKKIYYIEADYIWGREKKLYGWRSNIKDYSITLGAGIHMIDLTMWLLNSKPTYVTAFANNNATKGTKFKKNSFAIYIFEFPMNILVKITANTPSTYNHFHEVKIYQKGATITNFFNGSFLFKKYKNKTISQKINKSYPDKSKRKKLIHNFIDNLKNKNKKSLITLQEQINLMSLCFAADKSIKIKKRIKIKYH